MIKIKEEAISDLTPYLETLRNILSEAVQSYKSIDAKYRRVHSPRTRSSNIADYIKDFTYQKLLDNPHIKFNPKYGTIRLIIDSKYQLTFKKLDKNLKPFYIPTGRQNEFYSNQGMLEGMPGQVTNITAGYQWIPETDNRYFIVCLKDNEIVWQMELIEPENVGSKAVSFESPLVPLRRVIPKKNS